LAAHAPINPDREPQRGFTIIELMVVIGVLIMLTGLLMPSVSGSLAAARRNRALQAARQCHLIIELYCNDNKEVYPIGDKRAYSAQVHWHEPVLAAGYADRKVQLDGAEVVTDSPEWARFALSMAMLYDLGRMMPGFTVDPSEQLSVPVRRSAVAWPAQKGEMWQWQPGGPGLDGGWCCAQPQHQGAIVMADGAGSLRRWTDFVYSRDSYYTENRIGQPVVSTWGGVNGRDWPPVPPPPRSKGPL